MYCYRVVDSAVLGKEQDFMLAGTRAPLSELPAQHQALSPLLTDTSVCGDELSLVPQTLHQQIFAKDSQLFPVSKLFFLGHCRPISVILTLPVIPAEWVATILTTPSLTSQAAWASFHLRLHPS